MRKKIPRYDKISLFFSIALHVILLLLSLMPKSFMNEDSANAKLYKTLQMKSAIRVEVVDLPRYRVEELKNIDLFETPNSNSQEPKVLQDVKVEPPKDAMNLEKKVDQKKKLSDLRKELMRESKRKELVQKLQNQNGREQMGGNKLSQGWSTQGEMATAADEYTGKILAQIQRYWQVPAWIQASKLKSTILVHISSNGSILKKEFLTRSGNSEFDMEVMKAIESADPFPPPIKSLSKDDLEAGFVLGFPN